jgi:hypothetical protein
MLQIALAKDPNSSDAMAYMNLLYREKAAIADSLEESQKMVELADEWVGKALDARRDSAKKTRLPDVVDPDGPPPVGVTVPTPPPPPPPPPGWAPPPGGRKG